MSVISHSESQLNWTEGEPAPNHHHMTAIGSIATAAQPKETGNLDPLEVVLEDDPDADAEEAVFVAA